MDEGTRLESVRRFTPTAGSNPAPSARFFFPMLQWRLVYCLGGLTPNLRSRQMRLKARANQPSSRRLNGGNAPQPPPPPLDASVQAAVLLVAVPIALVITT